MQDRGGMRGHRDVPQMACVNKEQALILHLYKCKGRESPRNWGPCVMSRKCQVMNCSGLNPLGYIMAMGVWAAFSSTSSRLISSDKFCSS